MGRAMDRGEDFVIDMVVEVDSRGIDVDSLARRIDLPGIEILRTSRRGMIWLTALVAAEGETAAIREVEGRVLSQLSEGSRVVVATSVTSAPLGDLYARLDSVLADHELDRMDLMQLVEATLWTREAHTADLRAVESRSLGTSA